MPTTQPSGSPHAGDGVAVVGSPPCSSFSQLQSLSKDSERKRSMLKQGIQHLEFCCKVYRYQIEKGRWFVHEHLAGAWSWKLPCVQTIADYSGVGIETMHQCRYGQTIEGVPVMKPTKWMSNCAPILKRLDKKCGREHEHRQLIGGIAKHTEQYTPQIVHAILKGL